MTVRYGFQPMYQTRLAGPEDLERSMAKLAKRAAPKISVDSGSGESAGNQCATLAREGCASQLPDGAKPSPTAAPLQWQKPVRTGSKGSAYILSECGRYSVTKDVLDDEMNVNYSAWKLLPDLERHGKPWKQMAEPLGCRPTGDEAKALCQASADIVSGNP